MLSSLLCALSACGYTFKNAKTLGLDDFPPELTKSLPLTTAGPYKYEPERIVGRIVYLRGNADDACPTAVTTVDQISIGTAVILPPGQGPQPKDVATEPLVDGKLVVKANQQGSFGPVAQSLTGEGVYTIRVIELRYALSPKVPSDALQQEANKPLPDGYCRRYWIEYAQVIHGGSTKYTKVEGKVAGAAAAFQVDGDAFAESTNVQNRYIVNLGLLELIPSRATPKERGGETEFDVLSGPASFDELSRIEDGPAGEQGTGSDGG